MGKQARPTGTRSCLEEPPASCEPTSADATFRDSGWAVWSAASAILGQVL